ncbi:MAG: CPXCG motif-containing cysteine-rich protein [Gemmatimonadaceae bacterium]
MAPPEMNDDIDLDEEFPRGDGTAERSAEVVCPYCSESLVIAVDPGGGSLQRYVEDCEVCCNPWEVTLRFVDGIPQVDLSQLGE